MEIEGGSLVGDTGGPECDSLVLASFPGENPLFDNRLTFQKLEVFCAVVDLGGISRAAERLWVAQPVITAHVKSLERRLGGTTLLRRKGNNIHLTPAGCIFYDWAKKTLCSAGQMIGDLESSSQGDARTRIAVSTTTPTGAYLLPGILSQFQVRHSDAAISLSVSGPDRAFSDLEAGNSELAVTSTIGSTKYREFASEVIGHEVFVVVASPCHAIPAGLTTGAELADFSWITPPRLHPYRVFLDRQLALRGVHLRKIAMEIEHPEVAKKAVEVGAGIFMAARSSIERELQSGSLRQVEVQGISFTAPVVASARPGSRLPEPYSEIIDDLRRHLANRP